MRNDMTTDERPAPENFKMIYLRTFICDVKKSWGFSELLFSRGNVFFLIKNYSVLFTRWED